MPQTYEILRYSGLLIDEKLLLGWGWVVDGGAGKHYVVRAPGGKRVALLQALNHGLVQVLVIKFEVAVFFCLYLAS